MDLTTFYITRIHFVYLQKTPINDDDEEILPIAQEGLSSSGSGI